MLFPFKNKQRVERDVLEAWGETPGLFYILLFSPCDQFNWEAQASPSAHFYSHDSNCWATYQDSSQKNAQSRHTHTHTHTHTHMQIHCVSTIKVSVQNILYHQGPIRFQMGPVQSVVPPQPANTIYLNYCNKQHLINIPKRDQTTITSVTSVCIDVIDTDIKH